jgi:hypothetical protein
MSTKDRRLFEKEREFEKEAIELAKLKKEMKLNVIY